MLEKKLVTLAAVAGILLCGGCIFIPSGSEPPAPPPLIDLQGVHRVEVEVTESSAAHHVEPAALARTVADTINWKTKGNGIKAVAPKTPGKADAVLQITILDESAVPLAKQTADYARFTFHFKVSAKLTGQDGKVIWEEKNADYPLPLRYDPEDPSGVWKADAMRRDLFVELSIRLVDRMMYAK
jgi:hypothetical protein